MKMTQDIFEPRKNSFESNEADFILGQDFKPWVTEVNTSPTKCPSAPVTAKLRTQVQEGTNKVVLNSKKIEKKQGYTKILISLETGMEDIALHSGQGELILEIALKSKKCFIAAVASV